MGRAPIEWPHSYGCLSLCGRPVALLARLILSLPRSVTNCKKNVDVDRETDRPSQRRMGRLCNRDIRATAPPTPANTVKSPFATTSFGSTLPLFDFCNCPLFDSVVIVPPRQPPKQPSNELVLRNLSAPSTIFCRTPATGSDRISV